jgi:hypothetical protein
MGWAYGKSWDDREIGYSVEAVCDEEGCETEIDRGLAYLCGDLDQVLSNNGYGCGKYFCGSHLFFWSPGHDIKGVSLCDDCQKIHGTVVIEEFTMLGGKVGKRAECPVCADEVEKITQPEADPGIELYDGNVFTPSDLNAEYDLHPCGHKVDTIKLKTLGQSDG